ncbi:hypothetical protein LTR08_004438 [Meristemomyces frigidus]|nr:hypothetical protein LTR08_004438 [Meristemomyces frigidus]
MSRRQPDCPTVFNSCDNIERYMQEDGHQIWGWVIYRSDYNSEDDWQEFLSRLRMSIEKTLGRCGGLDMLPSLNHKVFEDRNLFDGVDAATIREHFRVWAATASEQEQGGKGPARSQRYQFCMQVDTEALHSVVHEAPPPEREDTKNKGWVKLIWKDWEPAADDVMENAEDQPIDGIAQNDLAAAAIAVVTPPITTENIPISSSTRSYNCQSITKFFHIPSIGTNIALNDQARPAKHEHAKHVPSHNVVQMWRSAGAENTLKWAISSGIKVKQQVMAKTARVPRKSPRDGLHHRAGKSPRNLLTLPSHTSANNVYPAQLGGFTLTTTLIYTSLLIHNHNRLRQATLLRQQHLLLNNVVEPQPLLPPPTTREVRDAGLWARSKGRWNTELEANVKKVQAVDWEGVVGSVEEGVSDLWRRAFKGGREGVEKAAGREG